jgi:hypothetical protein
VSASCILICGVQFGPCISGRGLGFWTVKQVSCTVLLRQLNGVLAYLIACVYDGMQETQKYCVGGAIERLLQNRGLGPNKIDINLCQAYVYPMYQKT